MACAGLGGRGVAESPEALGELTGVDPHRARRGAETVHRAGVEGHVWEVGFERGEELSVTLTLCEPGHLSPHHDPRARGQGEVAARALGLAHAALDALVHLLLDRRHRLDMGDVRLRVRVDDHPPIEQAPGVYERLEA